MPGKSMFFLVYYKDINTIYS